jgi:hypothetical protein
VHRAADVAERVREAMARRHFARAIDLCDLALNNTAVAGEIEALRALQAEARRERDRPYPVRPPAPEAYHRGNDALHRGDYAGAAALFRAAIAENGECAEAHAQLGTCLLAMEQFQDGWREFEWRLHWASPRRMVSPRWDGSPMPGKTLLLWDEQGMGDAIHFVRFAAPAAEISRARVIFHGRPRLARLFRSSRALARSIPRSHDAPRPDANASLMSLPAIMGLDGPAAADRYLFAERRLVYAWRERLSEIRGPRIGLVWQGSPHFYNDAQRSIPLDAFVPMLRAFERRASFFSLQKGPGEAQIVQLPRGVVLHQPDLDAGEDGFVDTAAVLVNLDLTITTDTSIAHLAGALGVPVWIVLGTAAEWRWGIDATTTPFYPRARLFRRSPDHGWDELLNRVSAAFEARLATRRECA